MKTRVLTSFNSLFAAIALVAGPAQAAIIFSFENAGIQQTSVPGVLTENFNSGAPSSAIGTYTNANVIPANIFGGAGGTGNYLTLNSSSTIVLNLNNPQKYFGLWWSAGDSNDLLSFYDGASFVASFTVGDIIPLLSPAYYGNPNGGSPAVNEPFAYLNFTANGTTSITRVEFTQTGNGSGGFESDNHSIFDRPIDPPGNPANVPDTGFTLALFSLSLGAIGLARRTSAR